MGGNNGHITDEVFKGKLDFAKEQGQEMLNNALINITEKINTNDQKGEAIVLFNALSWERTDPVVVSVKAKNKKFGIIDHAGNKVDHQIIAAGNGEYKVTFIAEGILSLGYKTYYVTNSAKGTMSTAQKANDTTYENEFYCLKFGNAGLEQIIDKQLNKELIDVNNFQAGQLKPFVVRRQSLAVSIFDSH